MVVYNVKYLKRHDCLQYIVSQNTWWSTMQSISKYMVVYNTKYLKIHGGLQCKESQNTWWFTIHSI